jgi:hypothetical protein
VLLLPRGCPRTQLTLGYFGAEESPTLDAAAPGWPGLPLRSLDLDSNCGECHVGARALEALGRLGSSLTQLSLSGGIELETHCTGVCGARHSVWRSCAARRWWVAPVQRPAFVRGAAEPPHCCIACALQASLACLPG